MLGVEKLRTLARMTSEAAKLGQEFDMSFDGHIENGVAVFDEPVSLPDGLKVRIVPVADTPPRTGDRKTLAERFKNVIGAVDDLPADLAEKHDQYLHGKQ